MTHMITMNEEQFKTYAAHSIAGYAQDLGTTYRQPSCLALEQATESFNELLPYGLETAGHHLFNLQSAEGEEIGVLWFGINLTPQIKTLFIYDLEIFPHSQRCGHAKQVMDTVEHWAKALGVKRLELNVFAHNQAAQALYSLCGLEPCEITMGKQLE